MKTKFKNKKPSRTFWARALYYANKGCGLGLNMDFESLEI